MLIRCCYYTVDAKERSKAPEPEDDGEILKVTNCDVWKPGTFLKFISSTSVQTLKSVSLNIHNTFLRDNITDCGISQTDSQPILSPKPTEQTEREPARNFIRHGHVHLASIPITFNIKSCTLLYVHDDLALSNIDTHTLVYPANKELQCCNVYSWFYSKKL